MFNGKALGLLTVALIFGFGAAVFANQWLQEQLSTTPVVVEQADTTAVVIAAKEIPFGQVVEDIHIRTVQWPKDLVPEAAVLLPEDAIGKLANQKILAGEPLSSERIVTKLAGSKLSALIGEDKRAITVRVNDVAGVAGFLLPGNRVDVLGTRMVKKRAFTTPVLQNIKVLAVDQTSRQDKDDPVVVRAVTLEADLDQSLILVKATSEGSVQLVLRNPEDLSTRIEEKKVATVVKKRVAPPTVKIIRGTSVNNATVRN